jgi:AbiV family abortive infection protein
MGQKRHRQSGPAARLQRLRPCRQAIISTERAVDAVSGSHKYDAPRETTAISIVDRNHRRKHFIGVVSGALINSRLDRVLGKGVVRKLLHEAESDELEKTRQSCLYIDTKDGNPVTPSQQIDEDRARTLVVFAGELMAEVLGRFPWEFERMLENVIAFEREIGFPEKKIAPRSIPLWTGQGDSCEP